MSEALPDPRGTHLAGDRVGHRNRDGAGALSIWPMFAFMAAVLVLVSLYTNERVLTPQVMANLAGRGGGIPISEDQVDQFQLMGRLAYGLLPLFLVTRVAVTALVLQMFTMLLATEVPYRDLFRASLWGFSAVIYGMFIRVLRLDLLGAGLTVPELSVVPDSVAALIMNPTPTVTTAYSALSFLSIHSLLWIAIIFAYLRFEARVTPGRALLVSLAGWTTISLAQLGLQAFTAQILR